MANRFDRRQTRAPRFPLIVPATVEKALTTSGLHHGRTVNLSRGGLALQIFEALSAGTLVHVTVYPPGRSVLTCAGWVAWADRPIPAGSGSLGVAFLDELDGDFVAETTSGRSERGDN